MENKGKREKKVLVIHHCSGIGGGTISFLDVVRSFVAQGGFQVDVALPDEKTMTHDILATLDCTVIRSPQPCLLLNFNGTKRLLSTAFTYFATLRRLKEWRAFFQSHRYDLVVVNTSAQSPILPILKELGIPSLCYIRETRNEKRWRILSRIQDAQLSTASCLSFLTGFDKAQWNLKGPLEVVIPDCYIPFPKLEGVSNDFPNVQHLIDQTKCKVLFLGGLSPIKGLKVLLDALAYDVHDDFQLIILGATMKRSHSFKRFIPKTGECYSNEMMGKIEAVNQKHPGKVLSVPSQVDLEPWYEACDVVVFPAPVAHQARPIYEAGFFQKPIIVSDYPNYVENLVDGWSGLFANPFDPKDWYSKLLSLQRDESLRLSLGHNNQALSEKNHSFRRAKLETASMLNGMKLS